MRGPARPPISTVGSLQLGCSEQALEDDPILGEREVKEASRPACAVSLAA